MASKDIASKYKDIISKSIQIRSGPPAVYQLRAIKEKFGTLTRMIVGERNPNKTNRNILLVGETGAGKSTLINAMVNYTMGVKWEDEVWFQIVEEEEKSQADSQTSDVIMYEIFGFEDETLPYSLTIIDTPGYGDTRGIKNDVIVSQRLLDLFRSEAGVHELHAVGLVMKATDNRVSDRLMYVFNSVMSLFGKNLEKNIVVLLTHSNGKKPKNVLDAIKAAKIKCANKENEPVYFLFNNSRHEEETEEGEELVYAQYIYQISMKGMKEFMKFLEKSASQKLMTTAEVLNERSRLTASVANLQERIKLTEMKQTEIRQIQDALKNNQDETKKNEKFTAEVDEVYKDKEDIDGGMWLFYYGGAVCCKVCEENCHYPGCTLAWKPDDCEVMKRGRCTVCSGKCPVADHVKEKWRYVNKTRKVWKTMEDVKEKYENNKIESEKNSSLLEALEKKMKQLTADKSQFLDDSYQHVVRLEQIALKADSASTIVHLDFLIEKMKEKGDTEKVQKLEEMRSRVDEGSRAALRYRFANLNFFCRVTNSSSKYKDIISKSIQIRSGPPAVYQLKTKKEKFGTLTRIIVGEKNPNKTNRNILLVGETGAGKSTLVNALTNYTMGVKWEDEVWFQIVEREKNKCQTESQTSDVIVYEIFGFEDETLPYSLTIIDTPGFGDTSGIEYDNAFQKFLELFQLEEGVYEVNAVGLVMKATDNRLSDRLMYVFNIVMSLFGKNLEEKIVALITHSEGRNPKNALDALQVGKIRCYKKKKNQPVYFLFDNCQDEDRTGEEEGMKYAKYADQISMKGMKDLTDFLEKSASKKLMTTVDVLKERIRLTACIQNLQQKIILTELKQTEIKQTQDALKKHEGEMKKNEGFTVEVDEVHKQKEDIDGGMWGFVFYEAAVCCTVCEETCHYPGCTMAWKPEYCEVMKEGHCTVCTNKCPASDHVKEKWRYVNKTSKVQKTMEDLKEKYNNGKKTQGPNESSLLQKLEMEMEKLTAEESQFLDESYHHVVRLEEIALKADSVSTVVHLDFLIKKMKARKEDEDDEKVQKLEEIRKNMDEGTRAALRHRQDS